MDDDDRNRKQNQSTDYEAFLYIFLISLLMELFTMIRNKTFQKANIFKAKESNSKEWMSQKTQSTPLPTTPTTRRTRNAGINLSYDTLKILDDLRGDVSKSRFTLRLIERAYKESQQSKGDKSKK